MIGIIFQFGNEIVEVRVFTDKLLFRTANTGSSLLPLDSLAMSKAGVLKEFPDLENDVEWKKKAIDRYNKKLASFPTEAERVKFVVEDLKKYGYIPLYTQKEGQRVQRYK